jgi:hypothetical protein
MSLLRRLFLGALAVLGLSSSVNAGLLPVNVTVTPDAGLFRWTYAIVLPTDSQIRPGDYFTIYDFGGLQTEPTVQPAGWVNQVAKLGPTPPNLSPVDNPTIPNLTWTYNGPVITTGQIGLGNFWAFSVFSDATTSFFTAKTHRTSDGRVDQNITDTMVPVPTGTEPPPGVPEPGTLLMAGIGLPLVGWWSLRRKKSRG